MSDFKLAELHAVMGDQINAALQPPYGIASFSRIVKALTTLNEFSAELVKEAQTLRTMIEDGLIRHNQLESVSRRRIETVEGCVKGLQAQVGTRDLIGVPNDVEAVRLRVNRFDIEQEAERIDRRDADTVMRDRIESLEAAVFGKSRG